MWPTIARSRHPHLTYVITIFPRKTDGHLTAPIELKRKVKLTFFNCLEKKAHSQPS